MPMRLAGIYWWLRLLGELPDSNGTGNPVKTVAVKRMKNFRLIVRA